MSSEIENKQSQELTIVIVTFNSSKIIQSCLEKINLDKYRVIIVDNNSQDNTLDIVKNLSLMKILLS